MVVSTLVDGSTANIDNQVLNVTGTVTDANGVSSLTIAGAPVPVQAGGGFGHALALATGSNTVEVKATDVAGNQRTITRTVTEDESAPVLKIASPADNSVVDGNVATITGTAAVDAVVTIVDNGGSPLVASRNGAEFSGAVNLVAGMNTIQVDAVVGGKTVSAKRTLYYQPLLPALAVTGPNQDSLSGPTVVLSGQTDPAATVSLSVDGNNYTPAVDANGVFSQNLTFGIDGLYKVQVSATAAAGTANTERHIIKSTMCAPAKIMYAPVTSLSSTYKISWTPSATAGVIYVLEEKVGDGAWTEIARQATTAVTLTDRGNGSYLYRVKAVAVKAGFADSTWTQKAVQVVLTCATPTLTYTPVSNTTGIYTVKWSTSTTPGVTYVLQEKVGTGGSFTTISPAGLTANFVKLTGRTTGNYQYQVMATRDGYVDSGWKQSAVVAVSVP